MRQVGTATQINGEYASVVVLRTSMCGENCSSCKGGCRPTTQKVLAKTGGLLVHPGDRVILELPDSKVLGGAVLTYLVPVVFLFVGYFVASAFRAAEVIRIISAIASAIFVFFSVKFIDNALKKGESYQITISKVLH